MVPRLISSTSVVVPSAFRLIYLVRAAQPDADRLWQSYQALISGKTEGDVGIICACAPSLNIFFRRFFRDRDQERTSNARGSGSHMTGIGTRDNIAQRFASVLTGTSARSIRSGPFEKSIPSTNATQKPGSGTPRVLNFSMDDIPEAYVVTDSGRQITESNQRGEKRSQRTDGNGKETRIKRPPEVQSWLNLDPESSEDENEKTAWYSEK